MLIYTTARKSYWPYILKQLSVWAVIDVIVIYLTGYFTGKNESIYWIVAVLLLLQFVNLLNKERVYKIVIDENAKNITQYYRSPFSGEGEKIHTLDKVQLYVKSKASSSTGEITTQSLKLYKSWRSVLDLDTKEDGFSPVTLQEIRQALESLLVPVTDKNKKQ